MTCGTQMTRISSARIRVNLWQLFFLLRRLLTLEHVACFHNGSRIDGDVSFVDVANDSFFIDQEGSAISKALLLVKDAIRLDDGAFEIAE